MATKWSIARPIAVLMALVVFAGLSRALEVPSEEERAIKQVEKALVDAAAASIPVSGNTYESPVGQEESQEESYQRVYEAFSKLMQTTTQNSLGNVRRLMARLNRLVGAPKTQTGVNGDAGYVEQQQQQQTLEDKTEQILERLDQVNRDTNVHTLSKLQEDISRLIATLNNAYLRNIRRVIERVNRLVGSTTTSGSSGSPSLQDSSGLLRNQPDRLSDEQERIPGFPGWDELLVAVDRMQKSLASFMRSSTRLITSG